MSIGWHLRLARADDARAMPPIERAAASLFRQRPELAEIDFNQTWDEQAFRRLIGRGHSLVAHVGGVPAGFLVNEPFGRELHIHEMGVVPEHQHCGIGAGLVRACMIDARNSGFAALTLTTFREVPWNGPFYARLGFRELGERDEHPRLAATIAEEARRGLPAALRCAMILPLG